MVTQILTYKPISIHRSFSQTLVLKFAALVRRVTPRPHAISSAGLLLVGLGIPFLMLLELIPATLLLGFFAFALITTGCLLLLYYI